MNNTREAILDAAAYVMRTRGLARATTKEIARASGFSEAALYKHFTDKEDLFLAVLGERMGSLGTLREALAAAPGSGTVRGNLLAVTVAAATYYLESFPINASIFAEQSLLIAHREALYRRNAGPHHIQDALVKYLRAEQALGRIKRTADPTATSAALLGACLQQAFLSTFAGHRPTAPEIDAVAADVVAVLLSGVLP
jgi:AcrR family transcriptional regulator